MYRRRFLRRPRRKIVRRRAAAKKPRVSTGIKKYVKREIHRNLENKTRINYAANQQIQVADATTCTWPLIIATTQGTGEAERVANSIRIVKGTMRMTVNLKPYDSTTNPYAQPTWVKVWVVRDLKNTGQLATMDSNAYSNFFRQNGGGLGFQSNTLDMNLDVNRDYFRVLYSTCFKLGISSHVSGPTQPSSYFDNSPFAKQLTINWAKWARKVIKFNDNSSYCQNCNLYLVFATAPADGTGAGGKQLCEFHYVNTMNYEDA